MVKPTTVNPQLLLIMMNATIPSLAELVEKFIPPDNIKQFKHTISCPITYCIMLDPVIAEDGFTYERDAIQQWFKTKETSPLTILPIGTRLISNQFAKTLIGEHLQTHPDHRVLQYKKEIDEKELERMISCLSNYDLVQFFTDNPAYLSYGDKLLFVAIKKQKHDLVKYFIANGVSVKSVDDNKDTLLHMYCKLGMHEMVKEIVPKFVECGMSLDCVNDGINTPLWCLFCDANCPDMLDIAKTMVSYGANIRYVFSSNNNYIHAMCANNSVTQHTEVFQYLLQNGVCGDLVNANRVTPFMRCVKNNHIAYAEILLNFGINLNIPDGCGIAYWCYENDVSLSGLKFIAEHCPKFKETINYQNNCGNTALHKNAYAPIHDNTQFLLDCGADVKIKNNDGNYALRQYLTNSSAKTSIIKCFIDKGTPIDKNMLEAICEKKSGIDAILSYMPNNQP